MPPFLRRVYETLGTLRENGYDAAGGLLPGEELCLVSKTEIWVESTNSINPAAAVPFLDLASGSMLCYLPGGKGAWLEAGQFRPVRDLEREVCRCFEDYI